MLIYQPKPLDKQSTKHLAHVCWVQMQIYSTLTLKISTYELKKTPKKERAHIAKYQGHLFFVT